MSHLHPRSTLTMAALAAMVLASRGAVLGLEAGGPAQRLSLAQVDWQATFARRVLGLRESEGQTLEAGISNLLPQAFVPGREPRLAISFQSDRAEAMDAELWVTDLSGKDPRRVATAPGRRILSAQAAPDGEHLAYLDAPWDDTGRASEARLTVVRVADGRTARIEAAGVSALQWWPDGRSLLFWRWEEGPSGPGVDATTWQPFRLDLAADRPLPGPVSDLRASRPGSFNPDGTRAAAVVQGKLVVETLATHARDAFDLLAPARSGTVTWSGDGRWLLVATPPWSGIARRAGLTLLVEPSTGRIVTPTDRLATLATIKPDEYWQVTSAAWIPSGHRLLFHAATAIAMGCLPPPDFGRRRLEDRWVTYDADTGAIEPVGGLGAASSGNLRGLAPSGRVLWDRTGRYVAIGDHLYRVEPAD